MVNPLIIRATAVVPLVALLIAFLARAHSRRTIGAALLAFLWNTIFLAAVNAVASEAGWWSFSASGGLLMGLPVDLLLAWAILWGPLPVLLVRNAPVAVVAAALLWVDLLAMPSLAPVVQLGDQWLIGEAVALVTCLVPGLLLARWVVERRRLAARLALQMVLFSALAIYFVPSIVFEATGSSWGEHLRHVPTSAGMVWLQLIAIAGAVAIAAVLEFYRVGKGTPYPWDPPVRLVTSGPYAFIANPMQASMTVVMALMGGLLHEPFLVVAAIVAAVFSAGIADWNERGHLRNRFGDYWTAYRQHVHNWRPRWRPTDLRAEGHLYVALACSPCSSVATWFLAKAPVNLSLHDAAGYISADGQPLRRIRYESGDIGASGVAAIACALEHLNLGYALVGWVLRLPVVSTIIQIIVDGIGGAPTDVYARKAPAEKQTSTSPS